MGKGQLVKGVSPGVHENERLAVAGQVRFKGGIEFVAALGNVVKPGLIHQLKGIQHGAADGVCKLADVFIGVLLAAIAFGYVVKDIHIQRNKLLLDLIQAL